MKKLILTAAVLIGITLSASAQFYTGQIFQRESFGDEQQSFSDYVEQRFRESDFYNYLYENNLLYESYNGFLYQDLWGETSTSQSTLFQGNQPGGGALQRGNQSTLFANRDGSTLGVLNLPNAHGLDGDQAPLGSGIAVLAALGGAYLVSKKRKKE